jgi:hypothetical protein
MLPDGASADAVAAMAGTVARLLDRRVPVLRELGVL